MSIIPVKTKEELNLHARYCKNCGQCQLTCPTNFHGLFKPLGILRSLQMEQYEDAFTQWELSNCLNCNRCMVECPAAASPEYLYEGGMNIANLVREMRAYAKANKIDFMKDKKVADNWRHIYGGIGIEEIDLGNDGEKIPDYNAYTKLSKKQGIKISDKGEFLFFTDNLEYGDSDYTYLAEDAIRLLNKIGITPAIVNTPGSGHDDYWVGNYKAFELIAKRNIERFEKTGATTLIVEDTDAYHTLKFVYPKYFPQFKEKYTVKHISEAILENNRIKKLHFIGFPEIKVLIHDTSRQGRMGDGLFNPFRIALEKIDGIILVESDTNRDFTFDIGTGLLIEDGDKLESMCKKRMDELKKFNSKYVVTASIKALYKMEKYLSDEPIPKDWASFFSSFII